MVKREPTKLVSGLLLGAALLLALTACSGTAGANTPAPAQSQPVTQPAKAAPAAPAAAQPATGAPQPANPQPGAQTGNKATDEVLAKGKLIFEKTAGGVGCAHCHGMDGSGQGPAAVGAPDNRGASEAKVRNALAGGVPLMSFIKLDDEEITAVVAYLQVLK